MYKRRECPLDIVGIGYCLALLCPFWTRRAKPCPLIRPEHIFDTFFRISRCNIYGRIALNEYIPNVKKLDWFRVVSAEKMGNTWQKYYQKM